MSEALVPIFVSIVVWMAVAFVGGRLTDLGEWYAALVKPSWQPPNWLFPPAWTTIFVLTAIATGQAWAGASAADKPLLMTAFVINAILNMAWSALFFRLRRPDWALYEVVFFWLSILALVLLVKPISTTAALLLLPYLAWVAFATYLNWTVARLNSYL